MKIWSFALACIVLFISSSANAALVSRLGGLAYYDTEADLTWLANASPSHPGSTDLITWSEANNWATNLVVDGISGWRLPTTLQPDSSCSIQSTDGTESLGYNCTGSELGNMFYNVLGSTAYNGPMFSHNANFDLFTGIGHGWFYWTSSEFASHTESPRVLAFYFDDGFQFHENKDDVGYTWAVYDGDVSAVPIPAAIWLFGAGLIGLSGFARRIKA